MIQVKDIAWLAGIVEGEGCISFSSTPKIVIKMKDEDIIKRVASILRINRSIISGKQEPHWSTTYAVAIYGTPAIEWLFTLYTFLGIRRRQKALEVINLWKARTEKFNKDTFSCGHPKKPANFRFSGKYVRCRTCALAAGR